MDPINSLPLIGTQEPSHTLKTSRKSISRGKQIKLKLNPIFRYNYFVVCYNSSFNQINGIKLNRVPRNKIYYNCYPILQGKYILLHIILDIIPYINVLWAIFLMFMWLVYERAYSGYRVNVKKLMDPFKKMVFCPELCEKFKCMNKFIEIPVGENERCTANGNSMTVMIYNERFKKMMTRFPYYRFLHMFHIFVCTLLIVISYLIVYGAIGINGYVFPGLKLSLIK